MGHPWNEIDLNEYEQHMRLNSVFQLQAMNAMMREQLSAHSVESVMILGVAGGNGLEHIDRRATQCVYGVDINENYLDVCNMRYPALQGVLHTLCVDLTQDATRLPHAELLIANLLLEYTGYQSFQAAVMQVKPKYVSCAVIVNGDVDFVSDSPFVHTFDRLEEILHDVDENGLITCMREIGYQQKGRYETELPNGKKLVRNDFAV